MRWILTVWLLATGCGELEFPAVDGGQGGRESDGLSGAAGAAGTSGMGHAGGGSVGGREPVQVPDGGMGAPDAGGAVDGAVAQDGGSMGSLDAGVVDSGPAPNPDCPVSGCLPVLWTAETQATIQSIKYSTVSLLSDNNATEPIRVEGVESRLVVLIEDDPVLDDMRWDRAMLPRMDIRAIRTNGSAYNATTETNYLPKTGAFRYLKLQATSDGTYGVYTWTLHGYEN